MKVKKLTKRLVIAIGLGAILSGDTVFSAMSEGMAACAVSHSELSGGPAPLAARKLITNSREMSSRSPMVALPIPSGEVVTEWNQHAVRLTLLPVSALAPVQQTRVMAIVQVAVHDAVNGITGEYATYLSPGPAPENASPEAAAIAAAHLALKNLFGETASLDNFSLDDLYWASLAAHGLSGLQLTFGDAPGVPITSTIMGITRQWNTFSEGLDEVIDARVYSGIHFRTADEVGSRQGGQVARFVSTHALRPCQRGRSRCS